MLLRGPARGLPTVIDAADDLKGLLREADMSSLQTEQSNPRPPRPEPACDGAELCAGA